MPGRSLRILVAESESEDRAALMWFLLGGGHTVEPVSNGLDAAAALEGELPDLAIVNLFLPGFDGRRLIGHMRADARLRRIPVLAVSREQPVVPLPDGVEFLRMPWKPYELNGAMSRAIGEIVEPVTGGEWRPRVKVTGERPR